MSNHDWPRLFELFERGLEVPAGGREAWLTQVASGNPALRRELERLFRGHEAEGILDRSPHEPEADVAQLLGDALADRYAIDHQLGRGGSAIVFLARERKHDRQVVIKVLDPVIAAASGTDRFRQEVRIAAALSHPHILALIDSGEAAGLLYYVMPFVEGETLRTRLARTGPLPPAVALPILRDIASALAHAHAGKVVHRDLKPENVLLSGDHAFLMDFGIATYIADARPRVQLTLQGQAVGTPAYMAPEQRAAAASLDERADVYSWGLLACETLTGSPPVTLPRPGRPLTLAGVSPGVSGVVSASLATNPALRPANAGEILQELTDAVPTGAPRSRRASRRWLAGGVALVAIAVGAVAVARWRPRPAPSDGLVLPMAVAVLRNETGDTTLATWGRLAADWMTQGLQETGLGSVVPWAAVVRADERAAADTGVDSSTPRAGRLAQLISAGTIVSGAYYLIGDSLQFRTQVVDAATGRLLTVLPAVTAPRIAPELALGPLRDRVMGTFAVLMDKRLPRSGGIRQRPPTYEAYQAFDAGLRRFSRQDYAGAIPEFRRAFLLDTSFVSPLLSAATSWWNEEEIDSVGAALAQVRGRQASLTPYHRLWFDALDAWHQGDLRRAYAALAEAARLAPDSHAGYNLALTALSIDKPDEALRILDGLDPASGTLREWSSYWTQLTHALHMVGDHTRELETARTLARLFPDRRVALVLEVRALAAVRDTAAIDSVLERGMSRPPSTYWSQGAAMVVAGEELLAHGYPASAGRYLERAIRWCREQLALDPARRVHRDWLGTALYDVGRWREAHEVFTALAKDYPERRGYRAWTALTTARTSGTDLSDRFTNSAPWARSADLFTRGRIAAARRDRERARLLFSEAVGLGIQGLPWFHASAARDLLELGPDRAQLPGALRAGLPATAP
jgi:serine/threonine-protein kinase